MPFEMIYGTHLFETWLDGCVSSDKNAITSCGRVDFASTLLPKKKYYDKNASVPSGMTYSTCLFKTQLDKCVPSGENAIASCGRAEFSSIEMEQ